VLRRERNHPTVARSALAEHLHDAARHATRREHELLRHTRTLRDQPDQRPERPGPRVHPARWELVGASGTAIDQATARYGEAIDRLHDTLHLYTDTATHLTAPHRPSPPNQTPPRARPHTLAAAPPVASLCLTGPAPAPARGGAVCVPAAPGPVPGHPRRRAGPGRYVARCRVSLALYPRPRGHGPRNRSRTDRTRETRHGPEIRADGGRAARRAVRPAPGRHRRPGGPCAPPLPRGNAPAGCWASRTRPTATAPPTPPVAPAVPRPRSPLSPARGSEPGHPGRAPHRPRRVAAGPQPDHHDMRWSILR